jgi:hypothetical protein
MLLAFILSQLPTFVFPGTSAWDAFAAWYAALPLP